MKTTAVELSSRIQETAEVLSRLPIYVIPDRTDVVTLHPRIRYKVIQSDVTRLTSIGQDILEAFQKQFMEANPQAQSPLRLLDPGRRTETLVFRLGVYPESMEAIVKEFEKQPFGRRPALLFPFVINHLADSIGASDVPVYSIDFKTNRLVIFGDSSK